MMKGTGGRSKDLLIEPVWNRNVFCDGDRGFPCRSFNRTSMESKQTLRNLCKCRCEMLLIEPVWNRNLCKRAAVVVEIGYLLIEPVWNRNTNVTVFEKVKVTFNRTSMESKLVYGEHK